MKLFCFTYAGGNAAFFNEIKSEMSSDIEIVALEYAGHGERRKEPCCKTFSELVADLYPKIKNSIQNTNEEYALFGYSMGTLAVTEIMVYIAEQKEIKPPEHVFLAAHEPQTKAELAGYSDSEMDNFVKERTIRFGGVPERLIHNNSFWRMYLPIYRADFSMIGRFDFNKVKLRTETPLTVFYSEADTTYSDIQNWKKYYVGNCDFIQYEGNHFFIKEHYVEMAIEIKKRLNINNEL